MKFLQLSCLTVILALQAPQAISQGCCSGGGSSPIALGEAIGVLKKNQIDLSANFQYYQSNKFLSGTQHTLSMFDNFITEYLFLNIDYGLTDNLTMSISSGYYLNKKLFELNGHDTLNSSGIADLIILPKYSIWNKYEDQIKSEITLGLGIKLPLGSYSDSTDVFTNPVSNEVYYAILPPSLQTTNGSIDFMFTSFLYRNSERRKVKFFASTMYIKKGWNSLGEKFGDYLSLGLFASRELTPSLSGSIQLKGEKIYSVQAADNTDLLALYNIDISQTGSTKIYLVPLISINRRSVKKRFSFFISAEIPLYQNIVGIQLGSQTSVTTGLSYRFLAKEPLLLFSQKTNRLSL
jgi:hypothetical protein